MMRPCRQAYLLALNYYNIKLKSCMDRNLQTQSNEKIDNIKLCVKNVHPIYSGGIQNHDFQNMSHLHNH